jgi:hypothetical protein
MQPTVSRAVPPHLDASPPLDQAAKTLPCSQRWRRTRVKRRGDSTGCDGSRQRRRWRPARTPPAPMSCAATSGVASGRKNDFARSESVTSCPTSYRNVAQPFRHLEVYTRQLRDCVGSSIDAWRNVRDFASILEACSANCEFASLAICGQFHSTCQR